jgi:hypothetical protein
MKFFSELFYDMQADVFEVQFERIDSLSARMYNITVIIDGNKTYNFRMCESDGVWKIEDKSQLPGWIIDFESLLSGSILSHKIKPMILG